MSKSEVIAEVGGDWKMLKAVYRPSIFIEASAIPVLLELDEQETVVVINPWPFI